MQINDSRPEVGALARPSEPVDAARSGALTVSQTVRETGQLSSYSRLRADLDRALQAYTQGDYAKAQEGLNKLIDTLLIDKPAPANVELSMFAILEASARSLLGRVYQHLGE